MVSLLKFLVFDFSILLKTSWNYLKVFNSQIAFISIFSARRFKQKVFLTPKHLLNQDITKLCYLKSAPTPAAKRNKYGSFLHFSLHNRNESIVGMCFKLFDPNYHNICCFCSTSANSVIHFYLFTECPLSWHDHRISSNFLKHKNKILFLLTYLNVCRSSIIKSIG